MNGSPGSQSHDGPGRRTRALLLVLGAGAALCGAAVLAIGFGDSAFLAKLGLDQLASGLRGPVVDGPGDTAAPDVAPPPASVASGAERVVAAAKSGTKGEAALPSDPDRPAAVQPAFHSSQLPGAAAREPAEPAATVAAVPEDPGDTAAEAEVPGDAAAEAEPTSPTSEATPPEVAPQPLGSRQTGEQAEPPPPAAREPGEPAAMATAVPEG
ncbi:MAG: hypothetical protein ACREJ5_14310, partial [Geminicoccaceae bacterium]